MSLFVLCFTHYITLQEKDHLYNILSPLSWNVLHFQIVKIYTSNTVPHKIYMKAPCNHLKLFLYLLVISSRVFKICACTTDKVFLAINKEYDSDDCRLLVSIHVLKTCCFTNRLLSLSLQQINFLQVNLVNFLQKYVLSSVREVDVLF